MRSTLSRFTLDTFSKTKKWRLFAMRVHCKVPELTDAAVRKNLDYTLKSWNLIYLILSRYGISTDNQETQWGIRAF